MHRPSDCPCVCQLPLWSPCCPCGLHAAIVVSMLPLCHVVHAEHSQLHVTRAILRIILRCRSRRSSGMCARASSLSWAAAVRLVHKPYWSLAFCSQHCEPLSCALLQRTPLT